MYGNVAAVILAAGFSSRMGKFKPLLELAGMSALERCVRLFQDAGVGDIRVVTGHRAEELAPVLQRLGVCGVANPRYAEGMFTSVTAGVEAIRATADAFFVHPVDLPLVRPATVRRLLDACSRKAPAILYPTFQGERGHPPLISARLVPEILDWRGAGGLQGVLSSWEAYAGEIEVADEQILRDMDTALDYRGLRERAETLHVPSEAECLSLLELVLRVDQRIVRHGRAVAGLAGLLGQRLNRAGGTLDLPLLQAAGLLHDLARKDPDHARSGATFLRNLGYGALADLVATHMDISINEEAPVTAGELLYLADKLVQGEHCVGLEDRFRAAKERHAGDPVVAGLIAARLANALLIQKRLEAVIGCSIKEVIEL